MVISNNIQFCKGVTAIEKEKISINKPISIGTSILDSSKVLMHDFLLYLY